MKASPFDYVRPQSLAEASAALAQEGMTTAAIAGGQSLLPMLNLRVVYVDLLVDIGRLEELRSVAATASGLHIGALTTHAAIEDGKIPDLFNGLLRRVAGQISYRAVRNHGTIGGSVALADPAADWPGCLMALGAEVRIGGPDGERREPISSFLRDAYTTSLTAGDVILGFDLPHPAASLRWGFAKVARKSGAFASSIALVAARGINGPASVVLGAAGSRPLLLASAARHVAVEQNSDAALRSSILADLKTQLPDADPYQLRLHTSTVIRAAIQMWAQS